MTLNGQGSILSWCVFIMFGYIYGEMWWNFDKSENLRMKEETFASFSDCDSGIKCCARCNLERFCGFAQYSTQERVCSLISTHVCGSDAPAPQWNVYKRIPVDITDTLVLYGAILTTPTDVAHSNANHAVDGDITTYYSGDTGSSWTMAFKSVWPIARVSITYFRPYSQMLNVNMSGTLFVYDKCSSVANMYGVQECGFLPESSCWHNATSINITSEDTYLGLLLREVKIFS